MANETPNSSQQSGSGPIAVADKSPARDPAQAPKADSGTKSSAGSSDPQKAADEAAMARQKAVEAQAKAADANKSDEQRAADKAVQEADDANARAAQAVRDARRGDSDKATTVAEAGVVAPHVELDTPATHPRAVKLGNDPSNPMPANGEHSDPELMDVRIERVTPDKPGEVITGYVHPDMVGDYVRAGWSVAGA